MGYKNDNKIDNIRLQQWSYIDCNRNIVQCPMLGSQQEKQPANMDCDRHYDDEKGNLMWLSLPAFSVLIWSLQYVFCVIAKKPVVPTTTNKRKTKGNHNLLLITWKRHVSNQRIKKITQITGTVPDKWEGSFSISKICDPCLIWMLQFHYRASKKFHLIFCAFWGEVLYVKIIISIL